MTMKINVALGNKIIDSGIVAFLGNGSAKLDIYTGSPPANADAAATGTLLCTVLLLGWNAASGCSADITTGAKTGVAVAAGTAGWGRLRDTGSPGTYRIDGTVGTSGTDFIIDNTTIAIGQVVAVTAALFTQPQQ